LLIAFLRERWSAMLGATALVVPEVAAARAALAREDFLAALVRGVVDGFRTGIRTPAVTPALKPFAEHNAGMMILSSLALAGAAADTMPPRAPVHMSISELARRFSVSRAHVLRLLRAAAAHGLIERGTGGADTITFTPALSEAMRQSVALLFLFFAHCARAALAETGSVGE
jgi:DNA-binding MarR family transcriptional regulator